MSKKLGEIFKSMIKYLLRGLVILRSLSNALIIFIFEISTKPRIVGLSKRIEGPRNEFFSGNIEKLSTSQSVVKVFK